MIRFTPVRGRVAIAGAGLMAAYRVYCMDGVNRVVRAEWIEAADDQQAVETARGLMFDCIKCEIWDGPRLVERFHDPDWPEPPDAA